MSKTVKQLSEEFEEFKKTSSNVQLSQFTCWHWEQVAAELEEYNRYGELIEMKVTSDHEIGKNRYSVTIWHLPLLNEASRHPIKMKGYYAGLESTKDKLS